MPPVPLPLDAAPPLCPPGRPSRTIPCGASAGRLRAPPADPHHGQPELQGSPGRRDRRGGSGRFPREGQRTGGCSRRGGPRPPARAPRPLWGPGPGPRALSGPGHAAPPPPPGPFVLGAAAPAGERGEGQEGAPAGLVAFFVRARTAGAAPRPPRRPRGNKGGARPRQGGVWGRGTRTRRSGRPLYSPDLGGPRWFSKRRGGSRDVGRLWGGWGLFTQSASLGK